MDAGKWIGAFYTRMRNRNLLSSPSIIDFKTKYPYYYRYLRENNYRSDQYIEDNVITWSEKLLLNCEKECRDEIYFEEP